MVRRVRVRGGEVAAAAGARAANRQRADLARGAAAARGRPPRVERGERLDGGQQLRGVLHHRVLRREASRGGSASTTTAIASRTTSSVSCGCAAAASDMLVYSRSDCAAGARLGASAAVRTSEKAGRCREFFRPSVAPRHASIGPMTLRVLLLFILFCRRMGGGRGRAFRIRSGGVRAPQRPLATSQGAGAVSGGRRVCVCVCWRWALTFSRSRRAQSRWWTRCRPRPACAQTLPSRPRRGRQTRGRRTRGGAGGAARAARERRRLRGAASGTRRRSGRTSIMPDARMMPVGFARFLPAMSRPTCRTPCSNVAAVAPTLAPGASPGEPVSPATAAACACP